MTRSSSLHRLERNLHATGPVLAWPLYGLALVETAIAAVLYEPTLGALGIDTWRVGLRLAATGLLLVPLPVLAVVLVSAALESRWRPAKAAAMAGGLVGLATGACAVVLGLGALFPEGIPPDASARRALLGAGIAVLGAGILGAGGMGWIASRPLRRRRLAPVMAVPLLAAAALLVPLQVPAPPAVERLGESAAAGALSGRSLVLVTVDTLRATHMSLHGYERQTTPEIDRWAADQVVFEDAVTPKGYTAPALATALTGAVPAVHGLQRHPGLLAPAVETLAEMVAAAGYHTAAFVTNPAITERAFGFDQGFVEWHRYDHDRGTATLILRDALEWASFEMDRPFFLWIHVRDPHTPYRPDPPWNTRFVDDELYRRAGDVPMEPVEGHAGPFQVALRDALGADWRELGLEEGMLSSPDWLISQYDGEIAYLDAEMGPFLARMQELWPDALVVLTADHGESLGEHGYMFAHGRNAHEPTARIPLVFSHPSFSPGRVEGLVGLVDVLPTVAELLDLETHPAVQGRPLTPFLGGDEHRRSVQGDRALRLEARNSPTYPTLALRTDAEKLVLVPRLETAPLDLLVSMQMRLAGGDEIPEVAFRSYRLSLFDLREDPEELRDVAELRADRVRELTRRLWRRVRADDTRRTLVELGDLRLPELDEATLEELRALGYLK